VVVISDNWGINDLQAQYGLEQERRQNAGIRFYMKTAELSSSMHLLQGILTPEIFRCQCRRRFACGAIFPGSPRARRESKQ
jgi:hypothetical protein